MGGGLAFRQELHLHVQLIFLSSLNDMALWIAMQGWLFCCGQLFAQGEAYDLLHVPG